MSQLVEYFTEYLQALESEQQPLPSGPSAHDLQVATTVLLVQVLRADLNIKQEEVAALVGAVENVLGLEHSDAVELLRLASERVASPVALQRAAALLDQHLARSQRIELVEWLWRVAFADAELLAHEEYLVRKVADLLDLTTADLVEAKVRAKEAFFDG